MSSFTFEGIKEEFLKMKETIGMEEKLNEYFLDSIENNDYNRIKFLIEICGVDVNAELDCVTAIHITNNYEIAKLLIENGAKINVEDGEESPLRHQLDKGHCYVKSGTIEFQDCNKIAKLLIENGANVNARDKEYATPLHVTGAAELANLLIKKGAKVNTRDIHERTPLQHYDVSTEVAKILIQNGADVNSIDKHKRRPLYEAAYYENNELIKLLIDNGATIFMKGCYTPYLPSIRKSLGIKEYYKVLDLEERKNPELIKRYFDLNLSSYSEILE